MIGRYWKAAVAFLAPGCALLIVGADDGFTGAELSVAALTCVVTAAAVWATPNREG
jgi:hypothetical protein